MWRLAAAYAVVEAAQEGDVRLAGDAASVVMVETQFWGWLMPKKHAICPW